MRGGIGGTGRAGIGFGVLCSAVALNASATHALDTARLIGGFEAHLGRTVSVDIVEPLHGPSTVEQVAASEYGQVRVGIPDAAGGELSLVPEAFRLSDPDRYRKKFDRVLRSPLRVRGELLEDVEMSRPNRRALVLRVLSIEPLELPAPIRVASVEELLADPGRFDRRVIEIEGEHARGFEKSSLEGKIWLSTYPDAEIVPRAASGSGRNRVRAVGVLFSKPGGHYGHLGGYPMMLVATRLEYR